MNAAELLWERAVLAVRLMRGVCCMCQGAGRLGHLCQYAELGEIDISVSADQQASGVSVLQNVN